MAQGKFDFGDTASTAVISDDRRYRYLLSRQWASTGKVISFICLNPSTADENIDDPTVRRCVNFAKQWGGKRLIIGNLFAFRATDPCALRTIDDPIGPDNEYWLEQIARESDFVIAAWGAHGRFRQRSQEFTKKFSGTLNALRLTKAGDPCHPLYLPSNLTPFILPVHGASSQDSTPIESR